MHAPQTLEEIRSDDDGQSFPREAVSGCRTALVLFAAGFFGRQDAFWIAEANMHATCIDTDADRLDAMAAVYPTSWDFLEADVYEWVLEPRAAFDVVTVDCPTGHFDRCAALLPEFCRLARLVVVLGAGTDNLDEIEAPDGWLVTDKRRRSDYAGGVFWCVVEAG